MSPTDLFIRRPVVAVVVNVLLLALGWRALAALPVRQYPRIEATSIMITTPYVGASAEAVRGFITTPIERAVSAIDGVDYVESTSAAGLSTVTVRLRLNHPGPDALAEVSARLNQVRSELPREAESPVIEIQRADRPFATFYLSFTSEHLDLTQLTEYLSREVQPELGTLEGVQRCGLEGPRLVAMRVWLDEGRLTAVDVTPAEVFDALARNNYLAAVGRTKGRDVQVDLLTDTDLKDPEEFLRLIVRERAGALVRLGDVARVELGHEEPMAEAGFGDRPAIYLSVWPQPSANELDVAARLRDAMERVRPALPPGVEMRLAYDGTFYMRNALQEITKTLAETVAIVALVVFLFMGSWRTVLVPLVAMPISLVGAGLLMTALGFSLNLLTILALVLAVGLVVDDAIVMVENVERRVREGRARRDAALLGARELFAPVVSMTITLAAVYAPIGFQGGLTGVLFREFAFTLAAAVVVSGVVAVTLSPVMSAALVEAHGAEGRLTRLVAAGFERVRRAYARTLDLVLELRGPLAGGAVLIALGAVPLYWFSSHELAPTEDEGGLFFVLDGAPDGTLDAARRAASEVTRALEGLPEARFVWRIVMPTGGFGGLQTVDWGDRARTTHELQPEAWGLVSGVAGVRAFPVLPPPLPGAGQFDVELLVTASAPPERMAAVAGELVGAAFASGKFLFADTDLKLDLPQVRLVIDRERVADLGLDLASVGRDLAVMLSGGYVNRFDHDGRSYKVIPQVTDRGRATPEDVLQLKVRARDGGLVSVRSFVRLETEVVPRKLQRFQQRNSVKVYGAVAPGVTKEEALAALEAKAREILPPGWSLDYAGESRQLRQEGSSLARTLGFALGLIYLVLAAQFGSFRDPLVVLLGSVPLALSGALVFTFLGLTTVNIYSQVGLITLVGLVAKNGILVVEFANQLQHEGLSPAAAAREAALTRLRPILMTSVATVVGHFPLVLVTGAGALARNSIGTVLVAGMVISTAFTLVFVPALYALVAADKRPPAPAGAPAPAPAGAGAAA